MSSPMGDQPIPGVTKDKIKRITIVRKRDHDYRVKKVGEAQYEPTPPTTIPDEPEINAPDDDGEATNADDENDG